MPYLGQQNGGIRNDNMFPMFKYLWHHTYLDKNEIMFVLLIVFAIHHRRNHIAIIISMKVIAFKW